MLINIDNQYITRDGKYVLLTAIYKDNPEPVEGLVWVNGEFTEVSWQLDGKWLKDTESKADLVELSLL